MPTAGLRTGAEYSTYPISLFRLEAATWSAGSATRPAPPDLKPMCRGPTGPPHIGFVERIVNQRSASMREIEENQFVSPRGEVWTSHSAVSFIGIDRHQTARDPTAPNGHTQRYGDPPTTVKPQGNASMPHPLAGYDPDDTAIISVSGRSSQTHELSGLM